MNVNNDKLQRIGIRVFLVVKDMKERGAAHRGFQAGVPLRPKGGGFRLHWISPTWIQTTPHAIPQTYT
jgi:hypothetical protein